MCIIYPSICIYIYAYFIREHVETGYSFFFFMYFRKKTFIHFFYFYYTRGFFSQLDLRSRGLDIDITFLFFYTYSFYHLFNFVVSFFLYFLGAREVDCSYLLGVR